MTENNQTDFAEVDIHIGTTGLNSSVTVGGKPLRAVEVDIHVEAEGVTTATIVLRKPNVTIEPGFVIGAPRDGRAVAEIEYVDPPEEDRRIGEPLDREGEPAPRKIRDNPQA